MAVTYVIWLLVAVAFAYGCYRTALNRGRDPRLWTVLGFFFGLIALAVLLVMPNLNRPATAEGPTDGTEG